MTSRTVAPGGQDRTPGLNGRITRGSASADLAQPTAAADGAAGRAAETAISPPPKLRRRPALIGLGIALIALGGVTAAWLTTTVGHTQAVLALREGVPRGNIIAATDLVTANINSDPALHTVPAGERDQVLGKRAAVDLAAGSLLTPDALTSSVVPGPGQALVGVSLTAAQLPAQPLRAGATVRIVDTPRAQEDPPSAAPTSTTAIVVAEHPPADNGRIVVDVTVPGGQADGLAARIATGRVALVLDGGR